MTSRSKNLLWIKAVENVQTTSTWSAYCELLNRRTASDQQTTRSAQAEEGASSDSDAEAIIDAIRGTLATIGKTPSESNKMRAVKRVGSRTIDILVSMKDLGTAVTALNPYASLAWSGVQFLLKIAVNNREVKDLILNNLPHIVYLISHYQTFEEVFHHPLQSKATAEMLDDALIALYTAILHYQITIIVYAGSKKEKFKASFQEAASSKISQTAKEVTDKENLVDRVRVIADRAITTQFLEDLKHDEREKFVDLFAALETNQAELISSQNTILNKVGSLLISAQEERFEAVLDWLSTYPFENSHNKPEKTALKGTGSWLMQNTQYQNWKTGQQSVLWLRGFVGSGKSCLAHVVIEDCKASLSCSNRKGHALAYFYFEGLDPRCCIEMAQSANVLRCLIKQLVLAEPQRSENSTVAEIWKSDHQKNCLSASQCVMVIKSMLSGLESATFVLDGFDECPHRVQRELVRCFADILASSSSLNLFISGRPTIETTIRVLDYIVVDIKSHNQKDIAQLVDLRITQALDDPVLRELYVNQWDDQSTKVRRNLTENGQGMFRWVVLAFDYLHNSKHYNALQRRLERLDSLGDLVDLYDVVWQTLMQDLDTDDQIMVRTLITFALHGYQEQLIASHFYKLRNWSRTYINVDHVGQAAMFKSTANRYSRLTTERIVSWCAGFIVMEELSDSHDTVMTLRFPHFSAKEYLRMRHWPWFSSMACQLFLSSLCLEALTAWPSDLSGLVCYASYFWADHLYNILKLQDGSTGLQDVLDKEPDLRHLVEKFITDDNPTEHFSRWTEWISDHEDDYYTWRPYWETPNLATKPCTSTCAMIYLNIGLGSAPFKDFEAHGVLDQELREDAFDFAASRGNWTAAKLILADRQVTETEKVRLVKEAQDEYSRQNA